MITIKDFMEVIDYRITEGSRYCWDCFGPNAHRLDSWSGDQDGCSISLVFDTQTHEVYQAEAHDYANKRSYRITAPEFRQAHTDEGERRAVDYNNAYDEVDFVDLDVDQDFLDKARAIVQGQDYDTRVSVPVDFTDEELLKYMKMAHERDITFNQLVEEALKEAIAQYQEGAV